MKKFLCLCVILSGMTLMGCSDSGSGGDPKLADEAKVDPRLKPAEVGGSKGATRGNVKGD